jgi:CDGSH-type Zn-finger protein
MAREVTHEEDGPYLIDEDELEEQDGAAYVCQCGLSSTKPYCDGAHEACAEEAADVVYTYDGDAADGERSVVADD